jgi:hypothetical protein
MTSQPQSHLTTRYELTFSLALAGYDRTPSETVVVHRTTSQGPGGHPIYSDETGVVRAEISDRGECRMIATSAHQRLRRPAACRALPVADDAVAA